MILYYIPGSSRVKAIRCSLVARAVTMILSIKQKKKAMVWPFSDFLSSQIFCYHSDI